MEDDGPHAVSRSLSLDIERMASGLGDQVTTVSAPSFVVSDGSGHLSADALAFIRGECPIERKKLMYSNSLRRRSIEVDAK